MNTHRPPRKSPRLAFLAVDFFITVFTLVVFGVFGGLFLLIALNGFSGDGAMPYIVGYFVVVLTGNALFASLCNLLIRRKWFAASGVSPLAACMPAVAVALALLLVGPPLAIKLIEFLFRR